MRDANADVLATEAFALSPKPQWSGTQNCNWPCKVKEVILYRQAWTCPSDVLQQEIAAALTLSSMTAPESLRYAAKGATMAINFSARVQARTHNLALP